jgi:hypothetical protein
MGFSKAVVAIRGNCIDRLEEVTYVLDYTEEGDLMEALSTSANFENGWTLLPDEELVFVTEADLLLELSEALETEVFAFLIQSTSATWGFSNFKEGESRIFLVQDGEIIEDSGTKLEVEEPLIFDADTAIEDLLRLAKRVGIYLEE